MLLFWQMQFHDELVEILFQDNTGNILTTDQVHPTPVDVSGPSQMSLYFGCVSITSAATLLLRIS